MSEIPKSELHAGAEEVIESPGAIGEVSANGAYEPAAEAALPNQVEITEVDGEAPAGIDGTKFVATAGLLAWVSLMAVSAEYSGQNDVLPQIPEMVATSMAHPALGYIGGGAAGLATLRSSPGVRTTAILAGASAANFLTEKAQSVIIAAPEFADFMSSQNLPETGKDYGFALLGAGLFMLQNRR